MRKVVAVEPLLDLGTGGIQAKGSEAHAFTHDLSRPASALNAGDPLIAVVVCARVEPLLWKYADVFPREGKVEDRAGRAIEVVAGELTRPVVGQHQDVRQGVEGFRGGKSVNALIYGGDEFEGRLWRRGESKTLPALTHLRRLGREIRNRGEC